MYYALTDTARLRKEEPCVVLFSVENTGSLRYIHPIYAVLLALLDGEAQRRDLVRVLMEAFSFEEQRATETVDKALTDFADFLVATPEPTPVTPRYEAPDFLYKPCGDPNLRRLSGPISIAWLVTDRCPFDCVYCCIRTRPADARDGGEMSTEPARRFLRDCVRSGVETVTFHGGEPFLRPDLTDLLAYLIGHDVHVAISSKLPMKEGTAARLAEIGLKEMQVSIDTHDAAEADRLVGRSNYLRGAFGNILLLQRYGIQVKSNTVVTRRNVHQVPELLRQLAERGVRKMSLSGYLRSFWKHDDELLADPEDLLAMAAQVEDLGRQRPELDITLCPLESPRQASLSKGKGLYSACSGGKSGLVVGADGRVSICDRLVAFDDAVVGNVTQASLLEIWNGPLLRTLVEPPAQAFAGTACAECGLMETCNHRTRCYYRAKMVDGRLFGPDYLCPVTPPPPIRFF